MNADERTARFAKVVLELERGQEKLAALRADLTRHHGNWSTFATELGTAPARAIKSMTFAEIDKARLVALISEIHELEARIVGLENEKATLKATLP